MATTEATRDGAIPATRARDRGKHVLAAMATLMAFWFGMTAPNVSPVASTSSAVTTPTAAVPSTPNMRLSPAQVAPTGDGR